MKKIKLLVLDIDGTLTDGKIYISNDGELMKAFDVKDGYAIYHLSDNDIIPIVITGRTSSIVERRCYELRIEMLYQGVSDKLKILKEIIDKLSENDHDITLENVAYMGDDIPDLECMMSCGLAGCPADATLIVRNACNYISPHRAGEGAVRDFIEYILRFNNIVVFSKDEELKKRLDDAISVISKLDFHSLKPGMYEVSSSFCYYVKEYTLAESDTNSYESHYDNIDIQWVYDGTERLYVTDVNTLSPLDEYDKENDIIHYYDNNNMSSFVMHPGSIAVLFPKDAHRSECFLDKKCTVKKIVGKLKISQ